MYRPRRGAARGGTFTNNVWVRQEDPPKAIPPPTPMKIPNAISHAIPHAISHATTPSVPISEKPIQGLLNGMCSEAEIQERQETRQIDKFEMRQDGDLATNAIIDPSRAIKKYQRSSADKKYREEDIRTVAACDQTVEFLAERILDFDINRKSGFCAAAMASDFFDVYSFMRDRLRAIRVDLQIQDAGKDERFIKIHEICLRFELLSMHLLGAEPGQARNVDLQMSLTSLSQTIDPLLAAYRRSGSSGRSEIHQYILLLGLAGDMKTFKIHLLKWGYKIATPETLQVAGIYYAQDYHRFLKEAFASLDFLSLCALIPVFSNVRKNLLKQLVSCSRPYLVKQSVGSPAIPREPEMLPVRVLKEMLCMEDERVLLEFLNFHGIVPPSFVMPGEKSDGPLTHVCLPPRQLTRPPRWFFSLREWYEKANIPASSLPLWVWPEDAEQRFRRQFEESHRSDFPLHMELQLKKKMLLLVPNSRYAIVKGLSKEAPSFADKVVSVVSAMPAKQQTPQTPQKPNILSFKPTLDPQDQLPPFQPVFSQWKQEPSSIFLAPPGPMQQSSPDMSISIIASDAPSPRFSPRASIVDRPSEAQQTEEEEIEELAERVGRFSLKRNFSGADLIPSSAIVAVQAQERRQEFSHRLAEGEERMKERMVGNARMNLMQHRILQEWLEIVNRSKMRKQLLSPSRPIRLA